MAKLLRIFRAGTHVANDGREISFSDADLVSIAQGYEPATHEAPLVVGHPADNAPAYGWVSALIARGGELLATPGQVDPAFAELVAAGRYKKISASFYSPDSPLNPKPGAYYLRHVGFLGAQPPAVKGLGSAEFSGSAQDVITLELDSPTAEPRFAEDTMGPDTTTKDTATSAELEAEKQELQRKEQELQQKEQELAAREAALKAREEAEQLEEANSFAEAAVRAGKILPRDRAGLVATLAQAAKSRTELEFSEDGGKSKVKQPASTWLRSFVDRLPKQVEYGEVAPASDAVVSNDPIDLAERAQQYQDEQRKLGREVRISDAVRHVQKGGAK